MFFTQNLLEKTTILMKKWSLLDDDLLKKFHLLLRKVVMFSDIVLSVDSSNSSLNSKISSSWQPIYFSSLYSPPWTVCTFLIGDLVAWQLDWHSLYEYLPLNLCWVFIAPFEHFWVSLFEFYSPLNAFFKKYVGGKYQYSQNSPLIFNIIFL